MFGRSQPEAVFVPAPAETRFSLVELKKLHKQLVDNKRVNDANQALVIEILRVIAEMVVYGDNKSEMLFDFFCEKNMLSLFLEIMRCPTGCPSAVHIQILQTLSILISCVRNETSLYYLLSNNYINEIILFPHDFISDESLCAQFASFMKSLSLKLNIHTVQFFFIEETGAFPILARAVELLTIPDPMIRIASQSTILNVYRVEDPRARAYALQDEVMSVMFAQNVNFMESQYHSILKMSKLYYKTRNANDDPACNKLEAKLDDTLSAMEDWFYYIMDLLDLDVPILRKALINQLIHDFLTSVLLVPLVKHHTTYVQGEMSKRKPFEVEFSPRSAERVDDKMRASLYQEDEDIEIYDTISLIVSLAYLLQMLKIVTHPTLHRAVLVAIFHPLAEECRMNLLRDLSASNIVQGLVPVNEAVLSPAFEALVQLKRGNSAVGLSASSSQASGGEGMSSSNEALNKLTAGEINKATPASAATNQPTVALKANFIKEAWQHLHTAFDTHPKIVLVMSYIEHILMDKMASTAVETFPGGTGDIPGLVTNFQIDEDYLAVGEPENNISGGNGGVGDGGDGDDEVPSIDAGEEGDADGAARIRNGHNKLHVKPPRSGGGGTEGGGGAHPPITPLRAAINDPTMDAISMLQYLCIIPPAQGDPSEQFDDPLNFTVQKSLQFGTPGRDENAPIVRAGSAKSFGSNSDDAVTPPEGPSPSSCVPKKVSAQQAGQDNNTFSSSPLELSGLSITLPNDDATNNINLKGKKSTADDGSMVFTPPETAAAAAAGGRATSNELATKSHPTKSVDSTASGGGGPWNINLEGSIVSESYVVNNINSDLDAEADDGSGNASPIPGSLGSSAMATPKKNRSEGEVVEGVTNFKEVKFVVNQDIDSDSDQDSPTAADRGIGTAKVEEHNSFSNNSGNVNSRANRDALLLAAPSPHHPQRCRLGRNDMLLPTESTLGVVLNSADELILTVMKKLSESMRYRLQTQPQMRIHYSLDSMFHVLCNSNGYSLTSVQSIAHTVLSYALLIRSAARQHLKFFGRYAMPTRNNHTIASPMSSGIAVKSSSFDENSTTPTVGKVAQDAPPSSKPCMSNIIAGYEQLLHKLTLKTREAGRSGAKRLLAKMDDQVSSVILYVIREEMCRIEGTKWSKAIDRMYQDTLLFLPPNPNQFSTERMGPEFDVPLNQMENVRKDIQSFLLVRSLHMAVESMQRELALPDQQLQASSTHNSSATGAALDYSNNSSSDRLRSGSGVSTTSNASVGSGSAHNKQPINISKSRAGSATSSGSFDDRDKSSSTPNMSSPRAPSVVEITSTDDLYANITDKNFLALDEVHLLPPTHSYGTAYDMRKRRFLDCKIVPKLSPSVGRVTLLAWIWQE